MNSILRKSLGLVLVLFIMVLGLSNVTKVRATETEKTFSINSFTAVTGDLTASDLSTVSYATTSGSTATTISSSKIRMYSNTSGTGNGGSFYTSECPTNGTIKNISITLSYNNGAGTTQFYGSTNGENWVAIDDSFTVESKEYTLDWSSQSYKYFKVQNVSTEKVGKNWPQLQVNEISITYIITGEIQNIDLTSISLTNVSLHPGQTGRTTITYSPANATDKAVTYAITAGSEYAKVANDGTITAKAVGVVTLTVTPNDTHASAQTCTITVTDYAEPALTVGNTYYLYGQNNTNKYELKAIEQVNGNMIGTVQQYDSIPSLFPLVIENGIYTNTVAFRTSENKYLNYVSGSTLSEANSITAESSWIVTIEDGNYVVKNVKTQNMMIRYNSSNPRFACYAGTNNNIYFYDPTTPILQISGSNNVYLDGTIAFTKLTNIEEPYTITWSSTNESAATIDSNGVLHPVGIGKTTIKATINTTESNEIVVTVLPNPTSPITIAQAIAIAETVGTTGTTEYYTTVGFLSYIQDNANLINITDNTNTIMVYKNNHGYDGDNNGTKVQVTGTIKIYDANNEFTDSTIKEFFTVTFDPDNGNATTNVEVLDGDKVDCPTPDPTKDGFTFTGWKNGMDDWDFDVDSVHENTTLVAQWVGAIGTQFINLLNNYHAAMSLAYKYSKVDNGGTDTLNYTFTGLADTGYDDWSDKDDASGAIYAGNSGGVNSSIQLRSSSSSGIITTASGGYAKRITISFNSNTATGRTVDIYGKHSAYTATSNLYGSNNEKGTKLGSIVYGTSTELVITGDYEYIGIRSNNNTLYIDSLTIVWSDYEFDDCDFRLRCGIQNEDFAANLAAISGDATYGIEVKTTSVLEKTVNYASNNVKVNTDNENNIIYVLIDLGDALTNADRLGVEFTVRPYVEYESQKYYASNANCNKTYSVIQLVQSYHNNPSTQDLVNNLYTLLQEMDLIN